ncbi:hydroxymethylbilane synthase [Sphingomonas sp. BN140010]|uniref:Hydroxymethylbilane synthase n=1 Tax=Sphingomonas arvum TaxID=2992113 RepID=A0ABT3JFA9_9SPHN|nr:hydroxymethylbilane synthase [Sphingomonas sp. BN140010]MCW3797768.1 hydroxymethylbilane synthase [Sphingomonas sp. BN140010]
MQRPPILGTRGSPLALAQARMVAAALEQAHGWEPGFVQLRTVRTSGDRIQDRPLAEVGGKYLWTKELDQHLIAGETDFSVHSMKDVESVRPAELHLAAMLPRADVRDRVVGASSINDLSQGALVGTSSPRRAAQLLRRRPDLQTVSIRGNVATRLGKVGTEVDATLLAAAGLDRLGISEGCAIETDFMLPAPAQAAVGAECRSEDEGMRALLAAINHLPTCAAVHAERAFAREVGGSCHSPVAALAIAGPDGRLWLRAELLSTDGSEQVAGEVRYDPDNAPETPRQLARDLLDRAPPSVRALFA